MGFYDANGGHTNVFQALMLFSSIVSFACSLVNIIGIYQLKLWNGHIMLILSMTWGQLLYDAVFYLFLCNFPTSVRVGAGVFILLGGFVVALFSNIISIVTFLVVARKKSVNVLKYWKSIHVLVSLPITIEIVLFLLGANNPRYTYLGNYVTNNVYYYFRLVSIAFNFLIFGIAYVIIFRLQRGKSITTQEAAVCSLVKRMQFYPLIQAISRSGLAWYEGKYGWNFDPASVTPTQFAAQCYLAILTPAASVGYMVIFILTQPKAYTLFMSCIQCGKQKETVFDDFKTVADEDLVDIIDSAGIEGDDSKSQFSVRNSEIVQYNPTHRSVELRGLRVEGTVC